MFNFFLFSFFVKKLSPRRKCQERARKWAAHFLGAAGGGLWGPLLLSLLTEKEEKEEEEIKRAAL